MNKLKVISAYLEVPIKESDKHWLWLRISSASSLAVEIKATLFPRKRSESNGSSENSSPSEFFLGYHFLREGINELPPLPLHIRRKEIEPDNQMKIKILVRTTKEPFFTTEYCLLLYGNSLTPSSPLYLFRFLN